MRWFGKKIYVGVFSNELRFSRNYANFLLVCKVKNVNSGKIISPSDDNTKNILIFKEHCIIILYYSLEKPLKIFGGI